MTLEQEVKSDNYKVSLWLLYYHDRKKEYTARRVALLLSSPAPSDGQPRGTDTTDTTGGKGQKLAELYEQAGEWLDLIAEVEQGLPWKMQIFLRLRREYRYARGRNGWTAPVQRKFAEEVAAKLRKDPEDTWIESRNTFTRWWDKIVEYAVRKAAKRGLL